MGWGEVRFWGDVRVDVNTNEGLKGVGSGWGGGGGQVGCEQRIEFFVKIKKKIGEGGGKNLELNFL